MKNQYRFLARIIIEAKTPLNIGSGNKGIKSDSLVLRDINGLPFIPGTTIAGLLRHTLGQEEDKYMGSQQMGSPLIITEAKMLDCDSSVLDGIISQEKLTSEFLTHFRQLPIRQHAKIGHRGATLKGGKFDEEIVLKGTRLCFEMEMLSSNKEDEAKFKELLDSLSSDTFRIGSGSRSGFGEIEVVGGQCQYKMIDLTEDKQKEWYLKESSSLSEDWQDAEIIDLKKPKAEGWTTYEIKLNPVDFMLFGSGLGNDKADMTFVRESFVDWSGDTAQVKDRERVILIPASSVKGALSHRLAFHYNKIKGVFADTLAAGEKIEDFVGKNNEAVKAIFGSEGDKNADGKIQNKKRGNVLISDIIQEASVSPKILNHVSIDRFTGGAIDGALFSEETLYAKGQSFELKLLVNNSAFDDKDVKTAFEDTLKDLCSSMLPLGGGVNRGNGCFEGTIKRNGELIYENN
jgi:CRISPR/Cas system CSM-associated protein Csm3 (group 7 of RAMP superfamily)